MTGHECIACGVIRKGNTEEGMICAVCHLIHEIDTVEESQAFRERVKTTTRIPLLTWMCHDGDCPFCENPDCECDCHEEV